MNTLPQLGRAIAAAFTLLVLSQFSSAQEKPPIPTEVKANQMEAENNDGTAYFLLTGNVSLTATNLVLKCDKLEIYTRLKNQIPAPIGDFNKIERILATGNVSIVQDERAATSGVAEVLPNDEIIVLSINPRIVQGGYTWIGTDKLIIERGKGRISAEGEVTIKGPPIRDFGFEEDEETIVPPTPTEDEAEESEAESGEEAEPKDENASQADESEEKEDSAPNNN